MDGVSMLLSRVLQACGVTPDQMAKLRDEIPKLQQNVPLFVKSVMDKTTSMDTRLAEIENNVAIIAAIQENDFIKSYNLLLEMSVKIDQLIEVHGEHITSQALPPEPPDYVKSSDVIDDVKQSKTGGKKNN